MIKGHHANILGLLSFIIWMQIRMDNFFKYSREGKKQEVVKMSPLHIYHALE